MPVIRVDIAVKSSNAILQKEDITFDSVPRIIIYKGGRMYSYDSPYDRPDLLVHHINRLLNPLVILKTEQEVEEFLNLNE